MTYEQQLDDAEQRDAQSIKLSHDFVRVSLWKADQTGDTYF